MMLAVLDTFISMMFGAGAGLLVFELVGRLRKRGQR